MSEEAIYHPRPVLLLVEDSPKMGPLLKLVLKAAFSQFRIELVCTLDDAYDALAKDHKNRISLVVTDRSYPRMDNSNLSVTSGMLLLKKIEETRPELPRVVITKDPERKGHFIEYCAQMGIRIFGKPTEENQKKELELKFITDLVEYIGKKLKIEPKEFHYLLEDPKVPPPPTRKPKDFSK